ncbi:MAG: hypothetical protein QM479_17195 [Pseudomonadota bacterium]
MLTYVLVLIGLPVLCVLWILFQSWLAKINPEYKGYQAGCGGCNRSCGKASSDKKILLKQKT